MTLFLTHHSGIVNYNMNKHFHPYLYHGDKRTDQFFEGWYFKHVHAQEKINFALIPGISKNQKDPHAFIQVIITPAMIIKYFRFHVDEFEVQEEPFTVRISNNVFSLTHINVELEDADFYFKAKLSYHDLSPIKTSLLMPNIMGPFSYLPKMECNHGVISMRHTVEGVVNINQKNLKFDREVGYIEKDWGTSFPEKYVWLQCNHFEEEDLSMMGSIALIPYLGMRFEGLIFNVQYQKKEYRFATYNLASFSIEVINLTTRKIILKKGQLRCEIIASYQQSGGLKSPRLGQMSEMIKEGLDGEITLNLYQKNQLIVHSKGKHAGIEFTGY
jgi:tocopherol cyclase